MRVAQRIAADLVKVDPARKCIFTACRAGKTEWKQSLEISPTMLLLKDMSTWCLAVCSCFNVCLSRAVEEISFILHKCCESSHGNAVPQDLSTSLSFLFEGQLRSI